MWIDLTTTISDGMAYWPDNAPVRIKKTLSIAAGDAANVTEMSLSVHTSTHVDAPLHFLPDGDDVTQLDLTTLIGPARVVEIQDPRFITADELRDVPTQPGDRLLFKTRNSDQEWATAPFNENFVRMRADAAEWVRERGIVCVGVDYLSVGPADTHNILLKAGISVIEGLALQHVGAGLYDFVCLPLKIQGADGAPARAIARKLPE